MDFEHTAATLERVSRLRAFLDERVRPAEAIISAERTAEPDTPSATLEDLKDEARRRGLWNLCVRDPTHGPGLSFVEYAPLAEMMGTSPIAQEATNCDAPSSINGDALIAYGSDEQRGRWLEPQLDGLIRSSFAMTEPDVASSDASNIALAARRDGTGWVLDGRKWWITGVLHPSCAFLLVMACTDPDGPRHGRHTVFVVERDAPGLTVVRNLPKFGYLDVDGHCELRFEGVRVGDDAVLGEVGGGFAVGQARLGPARVQHCMRTIGVAEEALRLMCERANERTTFGQPLSTRSNVGDWIAESRIEIDAARLLTLRTAAAMDAGGDKATATDMSIIKVHVLRTATTVLDRAIQVFGAAGVSDDTPLARHYASLRGLRIADGPDEVHLMTIARRELRRAAATP